MGDQQPQFDLFEPSGSQVNGEKWTIGSKKQPKVSSDGRFGIAVETKGDSPTYIVLNGETGDFSTLSDQAGFPVPASRHLMIESDVDAEAGVSNGIYINEYDASRKKISQIRVELNRSGRITFSEGTEFYLLAIRLAGTGSTTLRSVTVDPLGVASKHKGPFVEYNPGARAMPQLPEPASVADHSELVGAHEDAEPKSYFEPKFIPASEIKAKPAAHMAGRMAALQQNENRDSENYRTVLAAETRPIERKVSLIGTAQHLEMLEEVAVTKPLHPTPGEIRLDDDISYLVIAESASKSGPWSGFLDTAGSTLGMSLLPVIDRARSQGVIVIILADSSPSHFSWSIKQRAHFIIDEKQPITPEFAVALPVVRVLDEMLKEMVSK